MRTPKGVLPASGLLARDVAGVLRDHIPKLQDLGYGGTGTYWLTDAVRVGDQSAAARVYITVRDHAVAEAIVSSRRALKGTGFTVFDVLSAKEQQLHDQLWPLFLEARASGLKAQFKRARLYVDSKQVHPPRIRGRGAGRSG